MKVRSSTECVPLLACAAALAFAFAAAAADPPHIDVNNLFSSAGALVIWVEPNSAGVPPGILGIIPGVLIHEQVFLTCGHCTRASEPGIPPFIKVYVSFSPHLADDPSTWIPVAQQAWHPSTLPCGPDNACHWPDEPFPRPGLSDVGLVLLAQPVQFVKPANLPRPGAINRERRDQQEQFLVGFQNGIRHYRAVSPAEPFDDRWIQGDAGEICIGDSGSIRFFGPLGESGDKRRTAIGTGSGFAGQNCATGRSGFARLDNEDVLSWIDQQIQQWLAAKQ
jgi:hypothetical protein